MNRWTKRGRLEKQVADRATAIISSLYLQPKEEPQANDPVAMCAHGDMGGKHMFRCASHGVKNVSSPFSFVFICDECLPGIAFEEDPVAWLAHVIPTLTRIAFLEEDSPPMEQN